MKTLTKFLTVFLLMLLTTFQAWGWSVTDGTKVYMDNSSTQWSSLTLRIGHDKHNKTSSMSKVGNTNNLYYGSANGTWNDCSVWTIANNSGWSGDNTIYQPSNVCPTNYEITETMDWIGRNIQSPQLVIPTSKGSGSTSKCNTTCYYWSNNTSDATTSNLNRTQTVKLAISTDNGSTYSEGYSVIPATITVQSYKMASNTATSATSNSSTISSSAVSCSAALTATVTYSVSDIDIAYTFVGWYDDNICKSTDRTYSYTPTSAKTITARFEETVFYLKKSNGSSEGTKVGTFTKTGTGTYTCTWTSNTSSKAYFYVSLSEGSATANANFLGSKELTDGTSQEVWLYGTSSDKWGDAQYITNPYDGVDYVFTFTIGDKYYIKCDYPDLYTGLSVTKNPAAGSASNPTISKTYVTQGQSVNVEAKTAATGYKFDNWTSSNGAFGTATNMSTTFTPNANNAQAVANYSLINYTITYDPETASNFTYTTAPTSKTYGQSVEMEFTPATNYVIAGVTAYKTDAPSTTIVVNKTNDTHYSFTQPAYDVTVKVEVSLSQVQVTYGKSGNGTIVGKVFGTDIGASPASVDGGSTVVFTATPDANYTVEGWYANSTCTGDKLQNGDNTGAVQTYTINNIAEAKTVYVKFKETKYAVNIQTSTGIQSVTPSGSQQVGNVTPLNISATVATGYTWNQWTLTGNVTTTGNVTDNPISVKATGTGTVTATATENMTTITVAPNDVDMGTVNVASASVGVTTTQQLTATPNYGYKFTKWILFNAQFQDGSTETDATITIKGDGSSTTGTATAQFEQDLSTPWRLNIGVENQGGWQQPAFIKRTGESTGKVAYASVELTGGTVYHFNYVTGESTYKGPNNDHAEMPAGTEWTFTGTQRAKFIAGVSGTYTFKIDYTNNDNPKASYETPSTSGIKGDWTNWAHEDGTVVDNVLTYTHTFDATGEQKFKVVFNGVFYGQENEGGHMTRQNHENWTLTSTNGGKDIYLDVDMTGEYIFTYNGTTNKLSVTYPSETMIPVTVYLDGETASTVEVGEATHPTIEAPQYVNGKRFAGWQADEGVTLVNASARSTQITAVTGTGKSVRATYNSNYMVYFKNTPGWGDVHVFFYKQQYYDSKTGTGAWCKDKDGNLTIQVAEGYTMTRLNNKSDIWYYDYSAVSETYKTGTIAFNDHLETNNEWFDACQAAYRTDWDRTNNLSVFVPEKNITEKKNNDKTAYYNKGYWMKYDNLNSGYYLRVIGKSESGSDYEFAAASNGEPYKTTITLEGTQTYNFNINGCNGSYYRNNGEMTSSGSHSGWDFYEGVNNNCRITTSAAGDYTFTLTFGDGMLLVSVEYPLSQNDYRVVYTDNSHPCHPSTFIRKGNGNKDTVSFFIDKGKNPALKFQYCSNIEGSTVTWADVDGGTISLNDITGTGIYNFYLEQTEDAISCTGHELYTGDFYIRTAIAAGAWDAYKGSDDNLLPYIEYGLDESQKFKFTHAYTNWVEANKNVKFCIANDYSLCISDTLVGDDIIGTGDNADWLKIGANIRFMWNKNTNALSRAYLSGSTNTEDRYLVLTGDAKMFLDDGSEIVEGTEENHRKGLHANELNFTDKNNWVYQADIKAQPGCAVKLTAAYNNKVQYFIGAKEGEDATKTIISSSTEGSTTMYTMRVVYDFKTNRLTAGWVPDGQEITDNIKLGGDMLITRTHQEDAQQITFGDNGSISDIHNVYAVLTIKKDVMVGKAATQYTKAATNTDYDRTMYWISFPFDVKISEVFGVDGYAKKWIMQRYNGEKRAEIGWFQETETFWEYLAPTSTLQAYKGYLLILNAKYFNTEDADVWKNSATEANFYFPSAEKNVGIINKSSVTIDVPAHECTIDREFEVSTGSGTEKKNHNITDSHWNVIGVPTFQNSTASTINEEYNNFKSYYAWDSEHNTYNAQTTLDKSIRFNTMQAYMVQYAGEITWENVSVVKKNVATAPKYAYADEKNYLINLIFSNDEAEDNTFIHMADEASTDFVLNEDMMKITNAGTPNIYTYAGAYDVAFNETKMDNQTITIGVSAPKVGTYTFSMPKEFSGTAKLIDLVEGTTTDLNVSNYSVDLSKGTYNDRFQLLLEVEAKAPTSVEATGDRIQATGKTTKLLRNGNIYLINAGRVYNATGTMVR